MSTTLPATVDFHGTQLTVAVIDGVPHVAIKPICDALGVNWSGQYLRIQRTPILSEGICVMQTPSSGGEQQTLLLALDKLNGWLFGISTARIRDPERRARLLQYQRECFDVLAAHFGASARPVPLPYKEQPGQSLSEEQCAELRDMLTGAAAQVPSEMRRIFMVQGWSRLKAHFGCSYRQIPAERFDEATELIARYVACYLPPAPEQAPAPQINLLDQSAMSHAFGAALDWLSDVESFAGIDHEQKLPPDFPVLNIGMTKEIIGLVSYALECAQFLVHWDATEGRFFIRQLHNKEIVFDVDKGSAHWLADLVPESRLLEFLEAFLARKRKQESGETHNG